MKKNTTALLIATICLVLFVNGSCSAQSLKNSEVPAVVRTAFSAKFPGIEKIKWEKEGRDFEAGFKQAGKNKSAVFDAMGIWKETETEIAITGLPQAARDYVAKQLPDKKIKDAAIINKADGNMVYEAEIDGKDYYFDNNGKFIRSVPVDDDEDGD